MKRVGFISLLITTGVIAGLYYYWRQVTALPSWYTRQANITNVVNTRNQLEVQQATEKLEAKIAASHQQLVNSEDVELQLDKDELNNLLALEVAKQSSKTRLAKAVKAVMTDIVDGNLKTGAIVNISEISTAQLGKTEAAALKKVIKAFPTLEDKQVYIGVEGKPVLKSGQLIFDENSKIKIGNLSFTQAELSKKLGVSASKIKQFTKLQLQVNNLKVSDIELTDNKALLKGSVN